MELIVPDGLRDRTHPPLSKGVQQVPDKLRSAARWSLTMRSTSEAGCWSVRWCEVLPADILINMGVQNSIVNIVLSMFSMALDS